MKEFVSPFAIQAANVTKATLEGRACNGSPVSYALTVANASGTATLTTTQTLPPGVYRLRLIADCGCFNMPVHVPYCEVRVAGSHDGDGGAITDPIPTCEPA